jgi:hypothetical protein
VVAAGADGIVADDVAGAVDRVCVWYSVDCGGSMTPKQFQGLIADHWGKGLIVLGMVAFVIYYFGC